MTETTDSRADVKALLHRLWAAVVRYRGMVAAMLAFGFLEALFTKLPLLLLSPLMRALGEPAPEPSPEPDFGERVTAAMNAWFEGFAPALCRSLGLTVEHPGMQIIVACAVIAVICGVAGAVTIYFVQTFSRLFAVRVVADLRGELARHFLLLPLRFFGRQRMGEMISKVTNDTQVMQRSFELAADNVVVDPLMILFNIGLLAVTIPEAIWVLLVMVPLMAIPMYRQGRRVQKRSSKSLQSMGQSTESLNQILTGIRTVKAFQLEAQRLQDFDASTAQFLERTRKMFRAKGRSMAQTFASYQVGFGALLILLGWAVLLREGGGVRLGAVTVVVTALSTTYQHIKRLTRSYHVLMESSGALAGIDDILREDVDHAGEGGRPLAALRGDVELRDVWFDYGGEPVLRGIDLKVRAGQTVAFVGESGGGKSTLLDLLMRFHDPKRGAILVDGQDLREILLADYRAHTAVVSQQPFLFNTTVRANIAYGKPGATQAEIEAAAKAANIHDFIVQQPDGYDTVTGERGSNLSGGQMQRITIARAILRDPAILFLDEATSALDSENEEAVQKALDNLRRGRTSFVVAHRLSTIVAADLIVVLDKGRVLEAGSHAELLSKGGAYKRMSEKQAV